MPIGTAGSTAGGGVYSATIRFGVEGATAAARIENVASDRHAV
jgi:hypothetical protein